MENYGTAMEYMDIAADSAGTASEKYEAYLDSIEAKSQAFSGAVPEALCLYRQ